MLDALAGLAYCHQASGRDELAASTLRSLEELTRSSEPHHVDVVDSCRARLQLHRGEREAAASWARSFERDLHPASILYFLEVPVLTQARVLMATGSRSAREGALARLNQLHALSTGPHFNGQLIEINALRAVALAGTGQKEEALVVVARLLDVAGRREAVTRALSLGIRDPQS